MSPPDIKENEPDDKPNEANIHKDSYLEDEDGYELSFINRQEILTPAFYTKQEFENMNKKTWIQKLNEMFMNHYQLELIESRIKQESPQSPSSTCNVVDILERKTNYFDPLKFSDPEKLKRTSNYQTLESHNVKPSFWPERIYDQNYKKLNQEDSRLLLAQIEKYVIDTKSQKFEEPILPNINRFYYLQPFHSVAFSVLDFSTEDDDDQTQWSDDAI